MTGFSVFPRFFPYSHAFPIFPCSVLLRSPAREDDSYGFQEDLDIQPEAPFFYVLCIEFYYFLKICDIAPPADLPQAGYAGLHAESFFVVEVVLPEFIHGRRPGANKAHVAF